MVDHFDAILDAELDGPGAAGVCAQAAAVRVHDFGRGGNLGLAHHRGV
ncbi:MAG: hypothetical protein R3C10_06840 [Pirellulales bacterium]